MAEKENTDSFSRKAQDILHESLAISTEESHNSSNYPSSCGAMFTNSAFHEEKKKEKPYPCTKFGEKFAWASDYLRHNRLLHIQTKINSLYAMLGLEAVKWS